jgi:CTP:molybdopterin cytidylyltransferase MocA
MSSFGKWYEEKKNEELGDSSAGSSSWFETEQLLPLFNTDTISWNSMKASMEKQMPGTIMGMGYQQRFQVRLFQ